MEPQWTNESSTDSDRTNPVNLGVGLSGEKPGVANLQAKFKLMAQACSVFSCKVAKRRYGEPSCITTVRNSQKKSYREQMDFTTDLPLTTRTVQSIYPGDTVSTSQHVGKFILLVFYPLTVLANVSLPSSMMIHVKC